MKARKAKKPMPVVSDGVFTAPDGVDINITTPNTGHPGDIHIASGHALNQYEAGGDIGIVAGNSGFDGKGGSVFISSGNGGGLGGNYSEGGDVVVTVGTGTNGGPDGHFILALPEFADDVSAGVGGIPLNGWYLTGNTVKVRVI